MDTIQNETNICNITSSNEVSQLKDLISSLAEQVTGQRTLPPITSLYAANGSTIPVYTRLTLKVELQG
ncbi:hypothetical protein Pmani_030281 [Petrolisthes manimaculis]|uniref:Uncharacterized protein n=1 Tax=Petrolisthes manimaculis TaxID=1843537 RepID=A0AAE1TT10_9EUCA|nr:hypothetical protein Pmani_030281 [Petrolisthes manimaculis]